MAWTYQATGSTFIESRVVSDYNEAMEDEIGSVAGRGEHPSLLAVRFLHQFLHGSCAEPRFQPAITGFT